MRRLAVAHAPLAAVWFTRGGLHGEKREAESRRAMKLLGVDPAKLFFLRLPDNHLLDFLDDIVERLIMLIARMKPASIFVPAFEGGHADHDAVQLAAAMALKRMEPSGPAILYEFPMYHRAAARILKVGEFIPGPGRVEGTPMKLSDRLLKQKMMRNFRSQRLVLWPITGLKGGPMMVHMKSEPYRRVPRDRDYSARPHAGRLAYEYYTWGRFRRFASVASAS